MPQLWHFCNTLRTELADEQTSKANIGNMRLRLQELQGANREAQELRQQKADSYKKIDQILYHQDLLFVSKAIQTELISHHHNDLLVGYFGIKKTCKFLAPKY